LTGQGSNQPTALGSPALSRYQVPRFIRTESPANGEDLNIPVVLEGEDDLVCEDLLPGFCCRVSEFFYLPGEESPVPSPPSP
jgi:hypothetical protein